MVENKTKGDSRKVENALFILLDWLVKRNLSHILKNDYTAWYSHFLLCAKIHMSDADYRLKVALDAVNEIDESKIRKEMEDIGKSGGKAMSDWLDTWSKKDAEKVVKNMKKIDNKTKETGWFFARLWKKISSAFNTGKKKIQGLISQVPLLWKVVVGATLAIGLMKKAWESLKNSMATAREFEDAFASYSQCHYCFF